MLYAQSCHLKRPLTKSTKEVQIIFDFRPCCPRKAKKDLIFLEDEEEHTSTSNKGLFEKDQPNDQTVESPLKKLKKKSHVEKIIIAQRISTRTRAAKHVKGNQNEFFKVQH